VLKILDIFFLAAFFAARCVRGKLCFLLANKSSQVTVPGETRVDPGRTGDGQDWWQSRWEPHRREPAPLPGTPSCLCENCPWEARVSAIIKGDVNIELI